MRHAQTGLWRRGGSVLTAVVAPDPIVNETWLASGWVQGRHAHTHMQRVRMCKHRWRVPRAAPRGTSTRLPDPCGSVGWLTHPRGGRGPASSADASEGPPFGQGEYMHAHATPSAHKSWAARTCSEDDRLASVANAAAKAAGVAAHARRTAGADVCGGSANR